MKAGWEVQSLGEVCEYARGLTYKKADEVDHSTKRVLRANNIDRDTSVLDYSEIRYLREDFEIPSAKKIAQGSILICTASGSKSHLGKVALVDTDEDFAFGGFMGLITPREVLLPQFVHYAMTSQSYLDFIDRNTDGANINNLKFSQLAEFKFPIPPLEEQKQIVAVLDAAFEGLTRAKENAEANLQNARELFGAFLEELFLKHGDGWSASALQDVVTEECTLSYGIVQPGDDVEGGLPVVRPTDLGKRLITIAGLKTIAPERAEGYARTKLVGDEILLCVRGTTGVVSKALPELKGGNVTRGIVPIRFDPQKMLQDFGYYQFRSRHIQDQIEAQTYGAALRQINIRDLRKLSFSFPDLPNQEILLPVLQDAQRNCDALIEVSHDKLTDIADLRQSLLQKAFAGELT